MTSFETLKEFPTLIDALRAIEKMRAAGDALAGLPCHESECSCERSRLVDDWNKASGGPR